MKKFPLINALSIGIVSISMAFADPAAVTQVRENAVQMLNILNKANGKNDAQIRKQAEDYATPYFDFERITAQAMGTPIWHNATPQQKQALINAFKNKIRSQYAGTMMAFKNAKVQVHDKPVVKSANKVDVVTTLALTNGKKADVTFSTYRHGKMFRVYDIKAEGISIVKPFQSQFQKIVSEQGRTPKGIDYKKGIDALIVELNKSGGK